MSKIRDQMKNFHPSVHVPPKRSNETKAHSNKDGKVPLREVTNSCTLLRASSAEAGCSGPCQVRF